MLFTKENREKTRSGAKTQTRRVIAEDAPKHYTVGDVRYMCEPYVIDSAEHTSKRQVIGEYLDDGKPFNVTLAPDEWDRFLARKYPYSATQARFMYKSLARTFVEIVGLRREPLQAISDVGILAEGITQNGRMYDRYEITRSESLTRDFRTLWDSINAARGHGWDSNPTVLVVEYRLVTP